MKSKILVLLSTVVMALALMAQSTTQSSPNTGSDNAKTCACCNHDQADGKMTCSGKAACCGQGSACGKGASCCQGKDGKACPMMSKDQAGNMTCCARGKCSMASKNGKGCCGSKVCERAPAAS
jgi:hypothetical protein